MKPKPDNMHLSKKNPNLIVFFIVPLYQLFYVYFTHLTLSLLTNLPHDHDVELSQAD